MKDKTIEEVQELIGQPTYSLVNGTWVPPPHRKLFTPNEFYELFRDESVLFLGDSTQRRAADTLHILVENRNNSANGIHYVYRWLDSKAHHSRVFGKPQNVTISTYNDLVPSRGRIDNQFEPFYASIKSFRYEPTRNHTVIVVGVASWDNQKKERTSKELVSLVNASIHHLHREVPPSVQVFWKTSSWGSTFDWVYEEPEVKTKCSNYHIYLVNKVAKDVIESINADNLKLLDWSREILPYSFERLVPSGMKAEISFNGRQDKSAWHVGVKGRMLLMHMLAWEVNQRKALVPVPSSSGINATITNSSSSSPTTTPSSVNGSDTTIMNSSSSSPTTTPSSVNGSDTTIMNSSSSSPTMTPSSVNGSDTTIMNSSSSSPTTTPSSVNGSSTAITNSSSSSPTTTPSSVNGSDTTITNSSSSSPTTTPSSVNGSDTTIPNSTRSSPTTTPSYYVNGSDTTITNSSSSSPTTTPSSVNDGYDNVIDNSTILVPNSTSSEGHELLSDREEASSQSEANIQKIGNVTVIGTATDGGANVLDVVAGKYRSSSLLPKLQSEKRIVRTQEGLSLFVFFSVVMIMIAKRRCYDRRSTRGGSLAPRR